MTKVDEATQKIVECVAAGYHANTLYVSYNDLQEIIKEWPEAKEGTFFGLNITLVSEDCPMHVLPKSK